MVIFFLQKIADFGLAAQLKGADEKHYTMCGTPNYIAPYVTLSPPLLDKLSNILLFHYILLQGSGNERTTWA